VELAELQDSEVGDGTTSVVIVAAELLKRGTELVKSGIHPTTIMTGFRLALKDAVRFVKSSLMVPVCQLGDDAVVSAAKTSMASKLLNADELFWSRLAVDAVRSVKTLTAAPKFKKKKVGHTHTFCTIGLQQMARLATLSRLFIFLKPMGNLQESLNW